MVAAAGNVIVIIVAVLYENLHLTMWLLCFKCKSHGR